MLIGQIRYRLASVMSDDQGVTCCWKKTNSMTTELEMADVDGYGVPPHKCTICKLQQQKQHEHEETDSASVIAATQASQTAFLKHTIKGMDN